MDTTSHNFTFETWTFGGTAGSSILYDVAIISENNIWCVGEILVADSSPNGYTIYNGVHWNGNEWTLQRIMFKTICGQQSSQNAYPASSVIAFSENEIWVTQKGDQIAKIENGIQTQTICMPWTFSINKIWGTSSNDLYVVGNHGNIAHYNGSPSADGWTKIESGTSLNINDIWGDYNEKTGEWEILAVGGNILHGTESERVILKINDNQSEQINSEGANWPLSSIWFKYNRKYYVVGSGGKFQKKYLTEDIWKPINISSNYLLYKIRGNELNEIVGSGVFGELIYYNGFRWKSFINETGFNSGINFSVFIKDNLIAAVGFNYQSAAVTLGRR